MPWGAGIPLAVSRALSCHFVGQIYAYLRMNATLGLSRIRFWPAIGFLFINLPCNAQNNPAPPAPSPPKWVLAPLSLEGSMLSATQRQRLVRREIRIQNYMTSYLMHLTVAPVTTKRIGQFPARQVTREPHATETTSSRTRWRRTLAGAVLSK